MIKEKIYQLLWTFVLLLLIVGCNKDDSNNPDPVNNIPGDFEITVSDITPYTAMLSWTVPLTDEPNTIEYSIYLNESLLTESLTDTVFTLSELNENTPYTVKIKAKNEFGEKDATNNFTTDPVNNIPGDFEITVADITSYTARVTWTVPHTDEPTTIEYSIFLNESLLAENLADTVFSLTELDKNTPYNVKVKAKNEFGENDETKDFTTLPQRQILLKEYGYPNGRPLVIEYNEDGQIARKYIYSDFDTRYTYTDGKISTEKYYHPTSGLIDALYTYDATQRLTHLIIKEAGSRFNYTCTYDFQSNTNYTYSLRRPIDYKVFIDNYSVNIILNDEGNIVQYEELNLDTLELLTTTFEYTNGNLTKMIKNNGDILEISYDDKMSFHTYESGYPSLVTLISMEDGAGQIYNRDLLIETYNIPQFYRYLNKNNPLEYKLNGEVKTTFEYEYNEDDYPSSLKVNFNDGTTTGIINLTY